MRASKSELIESESIIREKNMEHHILNTNIQSIHPFLFQQTTEKELTINTMKHSFAEALAS